MQGAGLKEMGIQTQPKAGIRGKDGKPGAGAKAVFLWCDSSKRPKSLRDKSLISKSSGCCLVCSLIGLGNQHL